MKKYLLANVAILFAAACLWAADATIAEPKIDIEADATVSWGVDLGNGKGGSAESRGVKHGFKNAASWKVKFPLIIKGNSTSAKSDMPVYGEVTLKDIELNIQSKHDKNDKNFALDGKVDKLEAKLVFYGAYLTVYDKPDFKTNYANLWDPIKTDDFKQDKMSYQFKPGFNGFGTKIGYANKNIMDLDVGLKFGSNGSWDSKGENGKIDDSKAPQSIGKKSVGDKVPDDKVWVNMEDGTAYYDKVKKDGSYLEYARKDKKDGYHSKYGIGLDFSMKPLDKMLGIKFMLNSTFDAAHKYSNGKKGYQWGVDGAQVKDEVAFSLGTEVTSEPMDGLKLKFGFDGGSKFDTKNKDKNGKPISGFAWDMLFDTQYKWIGGGLYVASAGTPYAGYDHRTTDIAKMRTPNMAVYLKFETKGDKKEASNLVEGLDAGAHVGMYNLLTKKDKESKETIDMLLKLWAAYRVNIKDGMWIKPFATFWGETNHTNYGKGALPKDPKPYFGIAYDLGVTYSPVEKVEVEAKWTHGKLDNNKYWKIIKDPANYNVHNGTFTLGVKVKY